MGKSESIRMRFMAPLLSFISILSASGALAAEVARYPFDGDFLDYSGSGNHLTAPNVTFGTDCAGSAEHAADLNGVNGECSASADISLEPGTVSVVAMVYVRALEDGAGADTIIRKKYATNDDSYSLVVDVNSPHEGRLEWAVNRGSANPADGIAYSTTHLELNRWYHVAGTYDGSDLRIYVDGVLDAEVPYSTSIAYDGGELQIGYVTYSGGTIHHVDGFLDEVGVFDYALSSEEIQALLPPCLSGGASLVAYYPFCGNGNDDSGFGNDLTTSNILWVDDCGGVSGCAADYDGATSQATASDAASLRPALVSVAGLVYVRALEDGAGADTIIRKRFLTNDDSYSLVIDTNNPDVGQLEWAINRGSGNVEDGIAYSSTKLEYDRWYHVAGTYDGEHLRIYVNGVLDVEVAYSLGIQYDGGDLEVGYVTYSGGVIHHADGVLDEIRVYEGSLTAAEVLALVPPCVLPTCAPVASYPFDGDGLDMSENGNDLACSGVRWVPGCEGTDMAAWFDGIVSQCVAPDNGTLRPIQVTCTADVFINGLADGSGADTIIRKRYLTNDDSYSMVVDTDADPGRLEWAMNRGSGNPEDGIAYSNARLEQGRWYQVAGTYDGENLRLYVDGVLDVEVPYSTPIVYDSGQLEVGFATYSGGVIHHVDGWMDNVRVYDCALSAAEIGSLVTDCDVSTVGGPAGPGSAASTLRLIGNPSNSAFQFELQVDRETDGRVLVCDVNGRLVDTVFSGRLSPGLHAMSWDPERTGQRLASGVYMLRYSNGDESVTQRLVRIR